MKISWIHRSRSSVRENSHWRGAKIKKVAQMSSAKVVFRTSPHMTCVCTLRGPDSQCLMWTKYRVRPEGSSTSSAPLSQITDSASGTHRGRKWYCISYGVQECVFSSFFSDVLDVFYLLWHTTENRCTSPTAAKFHDYIGWWHKSFY